MALFRNSYGNTISQNIQTDIPCSKKVFELRRNGNFDEALILGRDCYSKNKEDEWSKKALGWVLFDLAKQFKDSNNLEKAREFLKELLSLNIQDDVLTPKLHELINQLNPERQILLRAKKASKENNHKEALRLYRESVNLLPEDEEANKGLGWSLSKELKDMVAVENPDIASIRKLLIEYWKLKFSKPDLLHSKILEYMEKISDKYPKFIEFIKWWDVNNFRKEDFQEKIDKSKQKQYNSLAGKIALKISKMIEDKKLVGEVDFAIDIIDRVLKNKEEIFINNSEAFNDDDIPF